MIRSVIRKECFVFHWVFSFITTWKFRKFYRPAAFFPQRLHDALQVMNVVLLAFLQTSLLSRFIVVRYIYCTVTTKGNRSKKKSRVESNTTKKDFTKVKFLEQSEFFEKRQPQKFRGASATSQWFLPKFLRPLSQMIEMWVFQMFSRSFSCLNIS